MLAVEWRAPGQLRMVERPDPVAGTGQAVVEVASCGICGTDLHSYSRGLAARPGQVLGHEFSGRVLSAPGVSGIRVGDRVAVRPLLPCGECPGCRDSQPQRCEQSAGIGYGLDGAFAEKVLIPRAVAGQTLFALPEAVDWRSGALAEPLAVGLHAIDRAEVNTGDVVLVLGTGMIGLGIVALLHARGVERIVAADLSALRRDRARLAGAAAVIDAGAGDALSQSSGRRVRADVVLDCAGSPRALEAGLRALRPGGKLVLVAAYGQQVPTTLDRVIGKEITLIGSMAYRDEFPAAIRLLGDGTLDADLFVSHTFGLEAIDEAFRTQADPHRALKVLVQPVRRVSNAGMTTTAREGTA
jgi:2-desacetyl-2-hydroxyethyl bacteriochlorophyllide A dehydrogenase